MHPENFRISNVKLNSFGVQVGIELEYLGDVFLQSSQSLCCNQISLDKRFKATSYTSSEFPIYIGILKIN